MRKALAPIDRMAVQTQRNGAAAKLGIPRSTLDSKIKQLNIKKYTFR
jgi:DNA-binding NtrC family response regulator